MVKDCINVLMVCGYGMGTSSIAEITVGKALKEAGINANLKHASLGEMTSYKGWVDVVAILQKLTLGLEPMEGVHMIPIVNIMDGKKVAKQIQEVVEAFYPHAKA